MALQEQKPEQIARFGGGLHSRASVERRLDADRLFRAMETWLLETVGPVGGLVLRKKWRDLIGNQAEVDGEEARALVYELGASLAIIMGDVRASEVAGEMRKRLADMGLAHDTVESLGERPVV